MTNGQKKDFAKLLFIKEPATSQKEIALRVGVSQVTLSKWATTENWEKLRKSLLTMRQERLAMLYDQLAELDSAIKEKPEGQRYANSKEADIYSKTTAAIKNLEIETSIADVIQVFINFNQFVAQTDLSKAKEILPLQDAYIKTILQ